jgi:hypothetical protein
VPGYFCLCPTPCSKPVHHRWPFQQLGCRRNGFPVHWCMQTTSFC